MEQRHVLISATMRLSREGDDGGPARARMANAQAKIESTAF
jgi:hypothetical protein